MTTDAILPTVRGPAVVYVASGGNGISFWVLDSAELDVSQMPAREKAICVALLEHSLAALRAAP